MEPKEILEKALAAVEDAKVPDDLREVAFSRAIDLFVNEEAAPSRGRADAPAASDSGNAASHQAEQESGGWQAGLANALKCDVHQLDHVFFAGDEGQLLISDHGESFGSSIAARAKTVALLFAGARQLAGLEDRTPISCVRDECNRLGVCDKANFSKHIMGTKANFDLIGQGSDKSLRIKPKGRDAFKAVVRELIES